MMSAAVRMSTLAVLTLVALPRSSAAQPAPVAPGQTVRIVPSAGGPTHRGRLVLALKDTVVLEHGQRQEWLALGAGDRLEIMRAHRSMTLPGALVGAAAGAVIGSTSSRHMCENGAYVAGRSATYCGLSSTHGALIGGAVGLGLGALVGSFLGSTRWEPVPREQLTSFWIRVTPAPGGGLAVAASVTF